MLFWKKKPASVDVCGFFIDNFLAAHILYQADCNMGDEEITRDIPKRIAGQKDLPSKPTRSMSNSRNGLAPVPHSVSSWSHRIFRKLLLS